MPNAITKRAAMAMLESPRVYVPVPCWELCGAKTIERLQKSQFHANPDGPRETERRANGKNGQRHNARKTGNIGYTVDGQRDNRQQKRQQTGNIPSRWRLEQFKSYYPLPEK
jgi:hypothetical protein